MGPAVSRQQPSVSPHVTLENGEKPNITRLCKARDRYAGCEESPSRQCKHTRSKSKGDVIVRELLISMLRAERQAPATDPMGTACCRVERQSLL